MRTTKEYKLVNEQYNFFLKQKARMEWIKGGDDNTRLFHQAIKSRRLQNTVYGIVDINRRWVDTPQQVNEAFLQYYTQLLDITGNIRGRIQGI